MTQMLNLTSPPSEDSYNVECISYQTFGDATIERKANLVLNITNLDDSGSTVGSLNFRPKDILLSDFMPISISRKYCVKISRM